MATVNKEGGAPPRRQTWPRDSYQVWHAEGTGRETFLEAMEEALRKGGYSIIRDDGWQQYDLRASRRIAYLDITTVTEHDEQGAATTRIRISSPPWLKPTLLVFLLLSAYFHTPIGLSFLPSSILLVFLLIACNPRMLLRQEVIQASKQIGGTIIYPQANGTQAVKSKPEDLEEQNPPG